MTKYELEALGLDAETIRAVQKLHGRDMAKLAKKVPVQDANAATRDAIRAMLPMLQDSGNLKLVLRKVNYYYHEECMSRAADAEEETL